MSYGYVVKPAENVPVALMEEYDIPLAPVIFRGSASRNEVAKHFVASVTSLSVRLDNLLKVTNAPIKISVEEYDAHFIVTELGYDKEAIMVTSNSEENYISFSKRIMPDFSIKFLDSCRFMASSLAKLAENLLKKAVDFENI
ncbi:hypothetical protein QTP88_018932 [Uroleucon formosanum]